MDQAQRGKRARSPGDAGAADESYIVPSRQSKAKGNPEDEALRNLMVKSLPKSLDEFELKDLFQPFGALERWKLVRDAEGNSKGYAFIKYVEVACADKAFEEMNSSPAIAKATGERKLMNIYYADQKGAEALLQSRKDGAASDRATAGPDVIRNLIVNHLNKELDEVGLREMFAPYGRLENVKLMQEGAANTSKGFGFVKYAHCLDAAEAIEQVSGRWNVSTGGKKAGGKKMHVAYAKWQEACDLLQRQPQLLAGQRERHPPGKWDNLLKSKKESEQKQEEQPQPENLEEAEAPKKKATPAQTPKQAPKKPQQRTEDAMVPEFELGSASEVADMIAAAAEAEDTNSAKVIARSLVESVYKAKLTKVLTPVVREALERNNAKN